MSFPFSTTNHEVDMVIIGGGIAGCMAGIRARDFGLNVVILEKGNTKRSGGATTGVDHCWCYIPEIHAKDMSIEDLVDDHAVFANGFVDRSIIRLIAENIYDRVRELESFGVEMRAPEGHYRLIKKIHRVPSFIHFAGRDMKVKLTRQAEKRGVKIHNRTVAVDILVENGVVCGVLAFNLREGTWHLFNTKSVVLSTGGIHRLFKNQSGNPFNAHNPPHDTGDGHAIAFRAGARLINMEFSWIHTGSKNFHRCGRGTYVPGKMVRADGEPLAKVAVADAKSMDKSIEDVELFRNTLISGKGPIYMDCTKNTREQNDYIRWALSNEGNSGWLTYLAEEGKSLDNDLIEFTLYEPNLTGGESGLEIDRQCKTSINGLYAAGDCIGGAKRSVSPGALVMGYLSGQNAALYSKEIPIPKLKEQSNEVVSRRKETVSLMTDGGFGTNWWDAQAALHNTMDYYAGWLKSQSMLEAGLKHLQKLRQRTVKEVKVNSHHDLYRALEVLNLIDCGELYITASLNRNESRGVFKRADYPELNDSNFRGFISLERIDGKIVTKIRPLTKE